MNANGSVTYLTTEELAARLHYAPRYILNCLKDSVLFEGVHYHQAVWTKKDSLPMGSDRAGYAGQLITSAADDTDGERRGLSWVT